MATTMIGVRVSQEIAEAFQEAATVERRSVSQLGRLAIEAYLATRYGVSPQAGKKAAHDTAVCRNCEHPADRHTDGKACGWMGCNCRKFRGVA